MITVDRLTASDWAAYSETAHALCFGEKKPSDRDRIDFALVSRLGDKLLGYVTCREHDADTIYWQFGGAFPDSLGSHLSWPGYQALVRECKELGYKRITTLIENTNTVMLKMAMKVGFKIHGVRFFGGSILVEHLLEFTQEKS